MESVRQTSCDSLYVPRAYADHPPSQWVSWFSYLTECGGSFTHMRGSRNL